MDRQTNQRQVIREIFLREESPLDPQEVLALARKIAPHLGLATVYRCIRAWLSEGFLCPVITPKGPTRYEIAGKAHHHHFHCRECGKTYETPGCVGNLAKIVPPGFVLEGHEVILSGRCAQCCNPSLTSRNEKANA